MCVYYFFTSVNCYFHYMTVLCVGQCVVTYQRVQNTLSYGGTNIVSGQTLSLCQAACTADLSCIEIDFDINANLKCFHHYTESTRQSANSVDKYVKQATGPGCGKFLCLSYSLLWLLAYAAQPVQTVHRQIFLRTHLA